MSVDVNVSCYVCCTVVCEVGVLGADPPSPCLSMLMCPVMFVALWSVKSVYWGGTPTISLSVGLNVSCYVCCTVVCEVGVLGADPPSPCLSMLMCPVMFVALWSVKSVYWGGTPTISLSVGLNVSCYVCYTVVCEVGVLGGTPTISLSVGLNVSCYVCYTVVCEVGVLGGHTHHLPVCRCWCVLLCLLHSGLWSRCIGGAHPPSHCLSVLTCPAMFVTLWSVKSVYWGGTPTISLSVDVDVSCYVCYTVVCEVGVLGGHTHHLTVCRS